MRLNRNILIALQILIDNNGILTALDLKNALRIPKSAAQIMLKDCAYWLKDSRFQYQENASKRVIAVAPAELEFINKALEDLSSSDYEFSKLERRRYLLLNLLENRYLINDKICKIFGISRNTCISDISFMTNYLKKNGFDLRVESSNQGYAIQGEEREVRRAILYCISLIIENYDDTICATVCRVNENYLFGLFGLDYRKIYVRAEKLMNSASASNMDLSLQSSIYISACLEIVLKRIKINEYLKTEEESLLLNKTHSHKNVSRLLKHSGIWQEVLHEINKNTSKDPEKLAVILLSEWEILQQMVICIASIWENYLEEYIDKEFSLLQYSERFVNEFEQRMAISFSSRKKVVSDIEHSLTGSLFRLRYRFIIRNPMYDRIKNDYRYVYEIIRHVCDAMPLPDVSFGDGEISYLTAQFAGLMLRENAKSTGFKANLLRIGIVCINNVGIGALLQRQIQNLFPDVETLLIPASHFSSSDFYPEADFIITTIALKTSGTIPVIRVNSLLSAQDKEKIFAQMLGRHSPQEASQRLIKDMMEVIKDFISFEHTEMLSSRLERLFRSSEYQIMYSGVEHCMLKDLITPDRIQIVQTVKDWKEAITIASQPLLKDESIKESYVEAMIMLIEKLGPYIVLAPGIALPHARKEDGVNKLAMSFLCCKERVYFNDEKYANLFFVLASDDGKSHIDALMHLSKIFSDESKLNRFLEASTVQDVTDLLSSDQ